MQLKILASSSSGNCYILENDKEALIIECGISIKKIKQALNFSFFKVDACFLTHEHLDHAKSAIEMLVCGVDLYTSAGTANALRLPTHNRLHIIKAREVVSIGNFKVLPFDVQHDAAEPLGFIINHPDTGNVLFLTDSFYVKNRFKNLHNIIIEANYSEEIIKKIRNGATTPDFVRDRVYSSHMSLETAKQTLLQNDLSKVQKIVLIHLSDGNSNAAMFRQEIENATGRNVFVADEGIIIDNFYKQPF